MFQLCGILSHSNNPSPISEVLLESYVKEINISNIEIPHQHKSVTVNTTALEQVVLLMVDMKITTRYIKRVPIINMILILLVLVVLVIWILYLSGSTFCSTTLCGNAGKTLHLIGQRKLIICYGGKTLQRRL